MSLTITLSDHAESIVRERLTQYASEEEIIDTALSLLVGWEKNDPEEVRWLRQAWAEGMEGPTQTWDLKKFKRECMDALANEKGQSCHA